MDLRLVKNNFVSPYLNICAQKYHSNVSFLSRRNDADSFTKNEQYTTSFENPYTNEPCELDYKDIDLEEPQEIECQSLSGKNNLTLIYSPKNVSTLRNKRSNKNIDVVVLTSENKENPDEICFHFFSKDFSINYGYGLVHNDKNNKIKEVYTKSNKKNIEGIIPLTNKYAVQHCKAENEEKPEIVSYPKPENYIENFSSGNRFVLPEKGSIQYNFFMKNYKNPDPNEVIKKVKNTSNWPSLKMYMPEKDVSKYYNNYIVEGFEIHDPICNEPIKIEEGIDITKKNEYTVETESETTCTIKFDPDKKGQIIDKKTKKPIDVFILELRDTSDKDIVSFHFLSKDLSHEFGHVEIDKDYQDYNYNFIKDYPKEKISGERIVIGWLENEDDEHYGGIGKLADKTEVQFCLENHIKPNIISLAGSDSHIAHFSRGKRFICPEKDSAEGRFLRRNYHTGNPNVALKKLLQNSRKTGIDVNLADWNLFDFMMYLPPNLVKKYSETS